MLRLYELGGLAAPALRMRWFKLSIAYRPIKNFAVDHLLAELRRIRALESGILDTSSSSGRVATKLGEHRLRSRTILHGTRERRLHAIRGSMRDSQEPELMRS